MRPEHGAARRGGAAPGGAPGVVLVLDDEPLLLRALERILRPEGHEVRCAESLAEARRGARRPGPRRRCSSTSCSARPTASTCSTASCASRLEVEVIVMTGHASVESAVGCMRRGAFDYLAKPFDDVHRVRATVRQAVERRQLAAPQPRARARAPGAGRAAGPRRPLRAAARAAAQGREPAPQREQRADPGRERDRQGARRPRRPRGEPAPRGTLRAGRLRRAPRVDHRERALRPRARRLHRRGRRARAVPHGARRDALPRRGRRDPARACRPSCCARSRARGASGRRERRRCRSTSA